MLRLSSVVGKAVLLTALTATLFAAAPAPAAPRPVGRAAEELRVLHVLLAIDTQITPEVLRPGMQVDLQRLKARLESTVPQQRLDLTVFSGDQVNPQSVIKYYRALNVGPEDGLLFCYSGHGCFSDSGHVLCMSGGNLARTQLVTEMQQKGAGLTVLLTNCCSNTVHGTVPPVEVGGRRHRLAGELDPLMKQLFFQHRGLVDITATTRGTVAFEDNESGGVFFSGLDAALSRQVSELDADGDGFVTWEEFYRVVVSDTDRAFQLFKQKYPGTDQAAQVPEAFTLPPGNGLHGSRPSPAVGYRLGVRAEAAPSGVKVAAVAPGSAAARLGLEAGDVVLAINGVPVRSLADYARLVDAAPGGKARLEVRDGRTGKVIVRDVTLDHAR